MSCQRCSFRCWTRRAKGARNSRRRWTESQITRRSWVGGQKCGWNVSVESVPKRGNVHKGFNKTTKRRERELKNSCCEKRSLFLLLLIRFLYKYKCRSSDDRLGDRSRDGGKAETGILLPFKLSFNVVTREWKAILVVVVWNYVYISASYILTISYHQLPMGVYVNSDAIKPMLDVQKKQILPLGFCSVICIEHERAPFTSRDPSIPQLFHSDLLVCAPSQEMVVTQILDVPNEFFYELSWDGAARLGAAPLVANTAIGWIQDERYGWKMNTKQWFANYSHVAFGFFVDFAIAMVRKPFKLNLLGIVFDSF